MLLLHHELIFGHQSWILTNLAGVAILHIVTLSSGVCLEQVTGIAPVSVGWKPTAHLFRPNLRVGG